jgi:hypothetical protein
VSVHGIHNGLTGRERQPPNQPTTTMRNVGTTRKSARTKYFQSRRRSGIRVRRLQAKKSDTHVPSTSHRTTQQTSACWKFRPPPARVQCARTRVHDSAICTKQGHESLPTPMTRTSRSSPSQQQQQQEQEREQEQLLLLLRLHEEVERQQQVATAQAAAGQAAEGSSRTSSRRSR